MVPNTGPSLMKWDLIPYRFYNLNHAFSAWFFRVLSEQLRRPLGGSLSKSIVHRHCAYSVPILGDETLL